MHDDWGKEGPEFANRKPIPTRDRFAEVADVIVAQFKHRAEVLFVHVQTNKQQILVGFMDEKVIQIIVKD